jgi:hypothetical protein
MVNEYDGSWLETYTGGKFHFLDPKPEEIDIVDIAHALSLTCRYGGHCRQFYSVAQHSVLTASSGLVETEKARLAMLMHDAHEAYIHDLPRPIKHVVPYYKIIETIVQEAIEKRFNIPSIPFRVQKYVDNVILATEARDLMPNMTDWEPLPSPLDISIEPWTPEDAEESFLTAYKLYGGKP